MIGDSIYNAITKLEEAGFSQFFINEGEMVVEPGRVNGQTPEKNTEHPVDQPVFLNVSRFHQNEYTYEGTVQIEVPEDMTQVTIAVSDTIGGTEVYYVVGDSVEATGQIDKMIQTTLAFDSTEESVNRELVVFFNGAPYTSNVVEFTRVESEE